MTPQELKNKRKAEQEAVYALAMAEFEAKGGKIQSLAQLAAPPIPTAK